MGEQNDFQSGSDYISFQFSPPPPASSASSSRLPLLPSNSTPGPSRAVNTPSSLPAKPESAPAGQGRKGKRKASDAAPGGGSNAQQQQQPGSDKKKRKKEKARQKGKDENTKSNGNGKGNGKGKGKGNENEKGIVNGNGRKGGSAAPTGPRNLKEERMAAERHAPWADLVDWEGCRDPAEMLNEEIIAFYKYVSPTRAEFEFRLYTIELITRAILRLWPDAEVTPFGSWQTQLYLPQGDIDLVVSNKNFSEANKARLLAEMARAVRSARITDVVAIISKARVPIIKFVTTEGKLNVDISLNQTNGISAGKIINQYLDALPGARQLILVVKSFLSQRSMNEVYTGGLGSYAVICLVISFLQVHPKLRRSEMNPLENLGTLLIEFFELYGRNFNYQDVGLSIRKGGFYYLKSSRGWQRPNQAFLLSIEDPQDRDNDISGGSFGIRQVKNTLAGAYELLLMRLFEKADEMSGRKSGRDGTGKKAELDPDRMSILTGVMGVTKETLKQRREIEKLHAEGRLQRMLHIPLGADPKEHVTNYRPPPSHLTDEASAAHRSTQSRSSEEPGPPRSRGRGDGSGPGVGAIIVDDDEVPSEDEDEWDSDFDDYEDFEQSFEKAGMRVDAALRTTTTTTNNGHRKINAARIGGGRKNSPEEVEQSGSEDGEIVEITPREAGAESFKGEGRTKDRYASVSEDSHSNHDEQDVLELHHRIRHDADEEEEEETNESRYNLTSKSKSKSKSKVEMDDLYSISDSDSDSDSDSSSVQEVEQIPQQPATNTTATATATRRKNREGAGGTSTARSRRGERRAFWAAKAGVGVGAGDDFEDGTEFIGLD